LEWYFALVLILGSLLVLMLSGLPIAFAFVAVNIIGVFLFWGGVGGLVQLIHSMMTSMLIHALICVPMFVLMGEVLLHSRIAPLMIDALDKWLGRLPGRLSLLSVGAGVLFSTLSGEPIATIAMLGSSLVPEMEKRGYKKAMTLGPILGSGCLASMIPPSTFAILLGTIGKINVGAILIAIILPGLLLAGLYTAYIIIRCRLQPSIAPPYDEPPVPLSEKLVALVRYVLPVGFIIFLVIGLILLGFATPAEASAAGALGCFILAAFYRQLNWEMVKKSLTGTFEITVMVFVILLGAMAFAKILAFTGATGGLAGLAIGLPVAPVIILIAMQVVVLFLGMFIEVFSIMMITLPIFMPIVHTLGFDPVWFAVLIMINIQVAAVSPPFGIGLFVMKGVAPPDTTIGDIIRSVLPFIGLMLIALALVIVFPSLALWLPALMR